MADEVFSRKLNLFYYTKLKNNQNLEHLLDEDIARILLTTIALDTYNFDEKLKTERWNELDI